MVYDPKLGIHVNKTKDATLWAPPTKEQLEARSSYSDSFATPGGKKATGVKGDEAITDKEGFVLDNEKKFIHAAGDLEKSPTPPADSNDDPETAKAKASLAHATALKTAGKSVSKAADSAGQTSPVVQQADAHRNYKDEFETGVTALGATPEQQKKDVKTYIEKADQQLQNSKAAAKQQAAVTKATREDLAKQTQGKDKDPMLGPDGKPLPTTSQAISDRIKRIETENAKAQAANDAERKKLGVAPPPPPDNAAVGTVAKPPTPPKASTAEKEGTAKNAWWNIKSTKDGDTTKTTTTTVTDTADGGQKVKVKDTKTTQTPDGGKTSTQTTESTTLGKGGGVTGKTTTQSTTETLGTQGQSGKGYIAPTGKSQSTTTSTQADGTTEHTSTVGETGKTKGGGTVGSETGTGIKTGADGSVTQTQQKTSTYTGPAKPDGKQAGVTTTHTDTAQTGADGSTQVTTGKAVTHTKQDGKGTTTAKTTTQTQTTASTPDGGTSSTKSITLTTDTTGDDGVTQGHTFSSGKTTSTDSGGRVTTTDSESTVDTTGTGGKTTSTHTSTEAPHTTSKTSTFDWEQTHSGQNEGEGDKKPGGGPEPVKKGVKWAGGQLFDPVDDDGGRAASTSGATQTTIAGKNLEVDGEAKIQVGQVGAKGQWELTTDNKEGTKLGADISGEANAVKVTGTGSAQVDLAEGVTGQGKVTGTAKVGVEAKGAVAGVITTEKVGVSAEAKAFIGGKAELEAEVSLTVWGLKVGGKGQGEVSYGAGGEAKIEGELSWTKVKVGGKLAGAIGLGMGGSGALEVDATILITGIDPDKVDQQMKAADGIIAIVRGLKDGSLKLPPGKTFADIRDQLQKQAEWYAKHPQKNAQGKTIDIAESLKKDLGLQKGKGGGYVTAHHRQSDWYCTNRPVINAPVALPPIVRKD